jgi:hypothetical protein
MSQTTIDGNAEDAVDIAFVQYRQNGLGHFANWFTMRTDNVDRTKVVNAMRSPTTRKAAENLLDYYKFKVLELQSMLLDSDQKEFESDTECRLV